MIIKQLIDEDFTNYKYPSMFIAFPYCSFKCGKKICHNSELAKFSNIEISIERIIERYLSNPITHSIIFGGMEPFDSYIDMLGFAKKIRNYTDDFIVIYTGYEESEIKIQLDELSQYKNIIIKFGRYIPNQKEHFDEILGVNLASDNQYGKVIS